MKKRVILIIIIGLLIFLFPLLAGAETSGTISKTVLINSGNFPDSVFCEFVKDNFDTNKDGILTEMEIDNVTFINCNGMYITTLKGIEYFGNLESLFCENNNLRKR